MAGLQFSDTTNKKGLIQRCEYYTQRGDTGISGDSTLLAQFTQNINAVSHQLFSLALQSVDGWDVDDPNHGDYGTVTFALTTNRDYPIALTEEVLNIKRVDVCYSGTSGTCYKAEPMDSGEYGLGMGNDTNIDGNFSKSKPYYDLKANSIFLYPRASSADVTAGGIMRVEWARAITEFDSADTTERPWTDAIFHELIAMEASLLDLSLYKPDSAQVAFLTNQIAVERAKFQRHYGKKEQDRQYVLKGSYTNYD